MPVCLCVYACLCECVCKVCTQLCAHVCVSVCAHQCVCVCMCTCQCECVCTQTSVYVRLSVCVCVYSPLYSECGTGLLGLTKASSLSLQICVQVHHTGPLTLTGKGCSHGKQPRPPGRALSPWKTVMRYLSAPLAAVGPCGAGGVSPYTAALWAAALSQALGPGCLHVNPSSLWRFPAQASGKLTLSLCASVSLSVSSG